jgi:RNA recognition motif-containing protein
MDYPNPGDPRQPRVRKALVRNNLDIPPIHTVFVRNLASEVTDSDLKTMAEEFGPTSSVFSLANRRGIGFVTFYDLRDAERCVNGLECRTVHNREIHTSYAYSPPGNSPRDPRATCATITVNSPDVSIGEGDIATAFAKYGEIKAILKGDEATSWTVKYFDLRAARKAIEETGTVKLNGKKTAVSLNLKDDDDQKSVPTGNEPHFPPRAAERRERGPRTEFPAQYAPPPYGFAYGMPPMYPGYPGYPGQFPYPPPPGWPPPDFQGFPGQEFQAGPAPQMSQGAPTAQVGQGWQAAPAQSAAPDLLKQALLRLQQEFPKN